MPLRTPSHRLGACPHWAEAAHDRSCLASSLIMSRPSLEFQLWFEFYTFYSNLQWQPQNTWGLIHQTMRHSRGFGPDENVVRRNQCLVWCCSVLVCCGNISVTFQFKDKASPPATVFCSRFHQSRGIVNSQVPPAGADFQHFSDHRGTEIWELFHKSKLGR